MKQLIIIFLFFPLMLNAKKGLPFQILENDPITKVFVLDQDRTHHLYVLRLHESGTAELNKYTGGKKKKFRQIIGRYSEKRRSIMFTWKGNTESRLFPDKLFKGKGGLYSNRIDAFRGRNLSVLENDGPEYRKVCFIDPHSNKLMLEREHLRYIDAGQIGEAITSGIEDDEEKVVSIVAFMCDQFSYGNGTEQRDLKKILLSNDPKLNSEGYAEVFKQLCTSAGLISGEMEGKISEHAAHSIAIGGEMRKWNTVQINGEQKLIDVSFIDRYNADDIRNSAYFLADPSDVAATHFLHDNEPDQFTVHPFVRLFDKDRAIRNFYPSKGIVVTSNEFVFVPVGKVKDAAQIKVYWCDLSYADVALAGEKSAVYTKPSNPFFTSAILETVPVKIPLENKKSGFMIIESEGIELTYMVLNNGTNDLYKTWFAKAANKNLIAYSRAILSGVLLGDAGAFNTMIGNTTNVKPYVLKQSAMEELQKGLNGWKGEIISVVKDLQSDDLIPEGETHVYRIKVPGEIELVYSGDASSGYGLRSIRSPFYKKEDKKERT